MLYELRKDETNMSDDTPNAEDESLTEDEMIELLAKLKREHTRINSEVDALHENGVMDMLKLKRMKKAKYKLFLLAIQRIALQYDKLARPLWPAFPREMI